MRGLTFDVWGAEDEDKELDLVSARAHVGVPRHPGHAHPPLAQTRHLIGRHEPALLQLPRPVTPLPKAQYFAK